VTTPSLLGHDGGGAVGLVLLPGLGVLIVRGAGGGIRPAAEGCFGMVVAGNNLWVETSGGGGISA